jgi:hypothetical protein
MWDDDDNNFSEEEDNCDPEKERRRVESLPIYQKAEELCELARMIIDSIDNEEVRMIHGNIMLEDSMIIPSRIASAEAVNDYIMKMENATIVKMHARSLQAQSASLVFEDILPKEYLVLLRKEIEAFRGLFKAWVQSFRGLPREDDGWGLFVEGDDKE